MTEEEAKKKWCPHARVDSGFAGSGVVNRYPKRDGSGIDRSMQNMMLNDTVLCIGSQCMAWRWEYRDAGEGYCGLAGR